MVATLAGLCLSKCFYRLRSIPKDLGPLKYLLGIEVRSEKEIFLSPMKYVFDLLSQTRKLGVKPSITLMIPNLQLSRDNRLFEDLERYGRLIGKLNYFRVRHPAIAYLISVVSQYMLSPTIDHWKAIQ